MLSGEEVIHYMNYWDEYSQRMIKTRVGGDYTNKIYFKQEAKSIIDQMENICLWEKSLSENSRYYIKDIVDKYLLNKFTLLTQEMQNNCYYPFHIKEGEVKHKTCFKLSFDMYKKALDKYKTLVNNDYEKWFVLLSQEHGYEEDVLISDLFYVDVEKWVSKVYSENCKMLISNFMVADRLSESYNIFNVSFMVDHPHSYTKNYVDVIDNTEDFLFTEELDSSKIFPMKDGTLLSVKEVLEYGKVKPYYNGPSPFDGLLIEAGIDTRAKKVIVKWIG